MSQSQRIRSQRDGRGCNLEMLRGVECALREWLGSPRQHQPPIQVRVCDLGLRSGSAREFRFDRAPCAVRGIEHSKGEDALK
jgi:hypothetical protein